MTTQEVFGLVVLFVGGTLLTLARRWKNDNEDAGIGIAGWTVFATIVYIVNVSGR